MFLIQCNKISHAPQSTPERGSPHPRQCSEGGWKALWPGACPPQPQHLLLWNPTKQQDQALGGQGLEWGLFWAVVMTQHTDIHNTWEDGIQSPKKVQVTHWEKQEEGEVLEEVTTGRSSDTEPRGRWRERFHPRDLGRRKGRTPQSQGLGLRATRHALCTFLPNGCYCLGLISSSERGLSTS